MKKTNKYIEDNKFIKWIFHPNKNLDEYWESYITKNPDEYNKISKTRQLLLKLNTSDKHLSREDKILLFSKISNYIDKYKNIKKITIVNFTKYAAIAILFFCLGSLLFYSKTKKEPHFLTFKTTEPTLANETRLIRPEGENIVIIGKTSKIRYSKRGQIIINNDTLTNLKLSTKSMPRMNQLIIPYGKTSKLVLPDSTRVWLNAGSRLIYPDFFDTKKREVYLVGEAFFDVTPNKKCPFFVQTTHIKIKVLGTKFNLSAYPSDKNIETVLTEGKIKIENENWFYKTTKLKPGQLAIFNKENNSTKLKNVDTENYTLWKNGLLKFKKTKLCKVVKQLERYYNIKIILKNPSLEKRLISGKLQINNNKETVLKILANTASASIKKIDERTFILT